MASMKAVLSGHIGQSGAARKASLKLNFSWTLAGNLTFVLSQWGILIALARLGTPTMVGEYAWGLSITAPVMILTSLSLREVQVTDVESRYAFVAYVALRFTCNVVALIALYLTLRVGFGELIPVELTLIIAATKSIATFSDIIYGHFQKHEEMRFIAVSMMGRGLLTLAGFLVSLWLTGSVIVAAAVAALAALVSLVGFDIPMMRRSPLGSSYGSIRQLHWNAIWSLFRLALPLGLAASLISLNSNVSRYFLGAATDDATLGIYTALAYPLAAGNLVISALSSVTLPRLSRHLASKNLAAFAQLLGRLCVLSIVMAVIAVVAARLFGRSALQFFFGSVYAAHADALVILVVGMGIGFINWFLNAGLTAAKMYRQSLHFQLLALVQTVILAAVLVPRAGLLGAAWVGVLVMSMGVIIKGFALWRKIGSEHRMFTQPSISSLKQ